MGKRKKWGGIRRQKQEGKRWGEEEMGRNTETATGRKENGEKRKWDGIRRQKQGEMGWERKEMAWNM